MMAVREWRTDRLHLRAWRHDEANALLEIRSDPEVAKWLGSPKPWRTLHHAEREISLWHGKAIHGAPEGYWAIVPDGSPVPVGTISLSPIPDSTEMQIGWYLHRDATGNGWVSEAATSVLERGIAGGLERIWALMWKHNEPSAKVARSSGMRELGVLIDPWYGTEEDAYSRMFIARADTHPFVSS